MLEEGHQLKRVLLEGNGVKEMEFALSEIIDHYSYISIPFKDKGEDIVL
jgi:hypothetical protein